MQVKPEVILDKSIMMVSYTLSKRPKKNANPLQAGILKYLERRPSVSDLNHRDLPRRYSRYGGLLVLGPTFENHSSYWHELLSSLTWPERQDLYRCILNAFNGLSLTHVAINAPISATYTHDDEETVNCMRSPLGLQPVFGDFGPVNLKGDAKRPTRDDFEAAYWTQTTQLQDIVQVWAPRWTMFSQGNIAEKSRILQAGLKSSVFPGLDENELGEHISQIDVVDFYVGIGYFAFCYLRRGVKRVWGWDINGWSVEGLRRGCIKNGWGVRIVQVDEDGSVPNDPGLENLVTDLEDSQKSVQEVRCVVFCGDNKWAEQVLKLLEDALVSKTSLGSLNIRHCNLGLLPTSQDSWKGAVRLLNSDKGGWLHVHENVEIKTIDTRQERIVHEVQRLACEGHKTPWSASCSSVEQVKSFAPGVIHCVFDINIHPAK